MYVLCSLYYESLNDICACMCVYCRQVKVYVYVCVGEGVLWISGA